LAGEASDPRNQKKYYCYRTPVRHIIEPTLRFAFKFVASIHAEGVENLPRTGPVILACNHMTNFDVFPLQFPLPRPVFFMGKEELFRNPSFDWVLRQLGGFPVFRGVKDDWAMSHAQKVLELGQVLGMFPEGTRSKGEGLKPAKTGIARLAQTVDCPIVAVALQGTPTVLKHFPRRAQLYIQYAEAIYPERGETALSLTERVMFSLAQMLPSTERGAYSQQLPGF
jgi:1-acyl-sn-glycerol-3-phosphate acyltransferase